jgi:cytochrome P450
MFNSRGRLGHAELYPVGPQALKDLFSTNAYDFVKPAGMKEYMSHAFAFGRGLLTVEGPEHNELRRKIQPAFKKNNIRALYPKMWQKAGILTSKLAEEMKTEGKVDISTWLLKFGLDVIGIGALSHEFHALERKGLHPVAEASAAATADDWEGWRYYATSMVLPQWALRHIYPKHAKIVARRAQFLRKTGQEIYEAGKSRLQDKALSKESILGEMIREPGLNRESVVDNILTFIGAGHDTSVASMTLACHLLTLPENIKYQQILRDDLRAYLPELSDNHDWNPAPSALRHAFEESPFLNAICEEALRLFPPVPTAVRRAVRQTTIDGTEVPKGTFVIVLPWAINRNPRYWGEDAAEFRPERWITQTADGKMRANKHGGAASNFNEATFLHGPHACIGRDLNRAELRCALAAIFSRFKVERSDGFTGKVNITGYITIKPKGGLHVKLTPIK